MLVFSACSEKSDDLVTITNDEYVSEAKQFAFLHNDCLAYMYSNMNATTMRGLGSVDASEINVIGIKLANKYVSSLSYMYRAVVEEDPISMESFENTSINDIKAQLSQQELRYTDEYLNTTNKQEVINRVANDQTLPNQKRKALLCFMETYMASDEYWGNNYDEWMNMIGVSVPFQRSFEFNTKEVVLADAWWAYQGLLTSGLNIYIGAGMAAVGSFCACLK